MRGQVFDTERNLYRQEEVQMAWRIEVYVHAQDRLQVKMNPIFEYLEITPHATFRIFRVRSIRHYPHIISCPNTVSNHS